MMTRIDYRPWGAVVLSTVVLAYVGCDSSAPSPAPGTAAGTSARPPGDAGGASGEKEHGAGEHAAAPSKAKLFADWPRPLATLIISGQRDGYLEPCGCTQGQQGGLIRLYDFAERIRKQDWPVTFIDLGGLIKDPASSRGGFEQSKIKFMIALEALTTLGCQAMALSADDLKIGVSEAMAQFMNLAKGPKVVVANVKPAEGFEAAIHTSTIVESGPVKFGITSVLDPEEHKKLNDPDKEATLPTATVKPPGEVLPAILADLEKTSDVQVLMVRGSDELAKELGKANPGFDVIVATSKFPDPPADPDLINDGKTMVVTVGQKGKYVGAVGVFPPGGGRRLRYQRVPLGANYDGPATEMKTVVEDKYREMLKALKIVEGFPKHSFVSGAPGAKFVGAETCKECHPKSYEKWEGSKHAMSFDSLLNDKKPNTVFDVECISCHTTGFEYTTGYRSEELTPHLTANQCENCHGPGSKHSAEPDNVEFRKLVSVSKENADKRGLCTHCHDEDNSPNFNDFAEWWAKIKHNDLDKYTDPKVHQGIPEDVARGPQAEPARPAGN